MKYTDRMNNGGFTGVVTSCQVGKADVELSDSRIDVAITALHEDLFKCLTAHSTLNTAKLNHQLSPLSLPLPMPLQLPFSLPMSLPLLLECQNIVLLDVVSITFHISAHISTILPTKINTNISAHSIANF